MPKAKKEIFEFEGVLQATDTSLWYQGIYVPDEIVQHFKEKKVKRFIATIINVKHSWHCAMMAKGDGRYFIMFSKPLIKEQKLDLGEAYQMTIEKDTSKYGMAMPEELGELLKQDPDGDKYFHALSAGKQRSLIHMVATPKTSRTRLNKALAIIDYLKVFGGKLDFKDLMRHIKEFGRI